MTGAAVPLLSKRRELAQFLQQLQHGLPSILLLTHGMDRLRHEPHGWPLALGVAEVAVSVLVLGAFVRAIRALRKPHPAVVESPVVRPGDASAHHDRHHIDWVDLCLAGMLAVEVWAHWHESGHIKRPTLLLVPIMLALGLTHGRIEAFHRRRRALRIGDSGLTIGGKFFTRFTAAWEELSRIEIEPRRARLVRKDGRVRVINLADLKNEAEVRAALDSVRARLQARASPPAATSPDRPASRAAPDATTLPVSSRQSP